MLTPREYEREKGFLDTLFEIRKHHQERDIVTLMQQILFDTAEYEVIHNQKGGQK